MSAGIRRTVERAALVFVESNTTGTGRLFVVAARELGFNPVLITSRPEKYPYLSQPDAPELVVIPRVEESEVEEVVRRRFRAEVAGITSSSEYFVATAAAVASRFKLPGPDV